MIATAVTCQRNANWPTVGYGNQWLRTRNGTNFMQHPVTNEPSDDEIEFQCTDHVARLRVAGNRVTIEFVMPDNASANQMLQDLLAAHAAGNPVVITLNNPAVMSVQ